MDILKNFDPELYNLYLAIQEDMGSKPLHAVSKAQLFVGKLHEKIAPHSEAFMEKFESELSWLMGLQGEVGLDEALVAHEMLYRMFCWGILTVEPSKTSVSPYIPPQGNRGGVTEEDVIALIEGKVLTTLCGMIKEMDTIMAVLDDIERKIDQYSSYEERILNLEAEIAKLKSELPSYRGLLKSLPRTQG